MKARATLAATLVAIVCLFLPHHASPIQTTTFPCTRGVRDASNPTAPCILASSVPTDGVLFPLGRYHFIAPNGDNGFGTTSPTADVHVRGNLSRLLSGHVTVGGGSTKVTGTGTLFTQEIAVGQAIGILGFASTVEEVQSDVCLRIADPHPAGALNALGFTDGALLHVESASASSALEIDGQGRVGLGVTPSSARLEVAGEVRSASGGFRFPDGSLQTTAADPQGALPSGAILLWSGALNDVPAGWRLCDGSGGTPDLRDRFVLGAGGALAAGATGGSASHGHSASTTGTASDRRLVDDNSGGDNHFCSGEHHQHSVSVDAANHTPPFVALAYIMKL